MITAMQSTRITVTNRLMAARHEVMCSIELNCFDEVQRNKLQDIIPVIDSLIKDLVPNKPAYAQNL
jgi:hypothetical protein